MKDGKRFDYRHLIAAAITLGFAALAVFVFNYALGRTIEGFRDFGLSIAYYCCRLFGNGEAVTPTVNEYPKLPYFEGYPIISAPSAPLPQAWADFCANWKSFWALFAAKENFLGYLSRLGNVLYTVCRALIFLLPALFAVILCLKRFLSQSNNDYNKDSRPLRLWKQISARIFRPVRAWLGGFFAFLKEKKAYLIAWAVLWAYSFNLIAVVLEFFAFYFYFVVSFDFASIYRQCYKLLLDLSVPFMTIPLLVWVILGLWFFDRFRKAIARARLSHYERRDRGFINARPIVAMVVGTMGKRKTTMLTDMCLSAEVMFRDKAFELLLENDLKFPNFPWICFENELRAVIAHHTVYNLATCRAFVRKKEERFRRHGNAAWQLYGYDVARYGDCFDDALKVVSLWDVLETYAQLYFIYVMESSLLISNYSIRTDLILQDLGNFPLWDSDFFERDSRRLEAFSRHAHIIDYDMLRIGKTVVENNAWRNAFEFGVVAITEIGKERRNMFELKETKKKDEDVNQKNDGFNDCLKMARHRAVVDNYVFLKIIADEQRPSSLGADARELFDIIHIRDCSDRGLAMPFFSLEELVYLFVYRKFEGLYSKYRFLRGDNTLFMYAVKNLTAALWRGYSRAYNRFGFYTLSVEIEDGSQEGVFSKNKYYLLTKKIYAMRFATDSTAAFFEERALRSSVGLNDVAEYGGVRATWTELARQGSFMIGDWMKWNKADDIDAPKA